jgi:hypothetical protein
MHDLGEEHPEALAAACKAISRVGKTSTELAEGSAGDLDGGHLGS